MTLHIKISSFFRRIVAVAAVAIVKTGKSFHVDFYSLTAGWPTKCAVIIRLAKAKHFSYLSSRIISSYSKKFSLTFVCVCVLWYSVYAFILAPFCRIDFVLCANQSSCARCPHSRRYALHFPISYCYGVYNNSNGYFNYVLFRHFQNRQIILIFNDVYSLGSGTHTKQYQNSRDGKTGSNIHDTKKNIKWLRSKDISHKKPIETEVVYRSLIEFLFSFMKWTRYLRQTGAKHPR